MIKKIAASLKKVYDMEPNLERQGSLGDLKAWMHALWSESPSEVFSYMFCEVTM